MKCVKFLHTFSLHHLYSNGINKCIEFSTSLTLQHPQKSQILIQNGFKNKKILLFCKNYKNSQLSVLFILFLMEVYPSDVCSLANSSIKVKKLNGKQKKETDKDNPEDRKKGQNPHQFSSKEIQLILKYIDLEMTPDEIVTLMKAAPGSSYEKAILEKIGMILKPPAPHPENRKKIIPRNTGNPMLPLYLYQGKQDLTRKYYTLIVLGEIGSGKTTLLDAFVNYLNGMEYKDNWRWRLVDESKLNDRQDGKSKTEDITVYYINDVHNRFNVRIIDSPGFGDAGGLKVDDQITNKFETLFKEIPQIDYILLTVKASETRKMVGTRYVFDRVQQLFGLNAKSHFILMCTFADGTIPRCLQTLQANFSYEKYFKFNNCAIYTPSDLGDAQAKFFWKMAMDSIRLFVDYVIDTERTPLSLQMSKQVLGIRKQLQASIETSQKRYNETMMQLNYATKIFKSLQQNREKTEKNGKYTETISYSEYEETPLNGFYQMCLNCQITCCQICSWPQGLKYSRCTDFLNGGKCQRCPGKCAKEAHKRTNKKIVKVIKYRQQVIDLKKQFYNQGLTGVKIDRKAFKQKRDQIQRLANIVWKETQDIKQNLRHLQKTALKPKLFTDAQFYQQMIENEESTKEEGWTERVQQIKEVIYNLKVLENMKKSSTIEDLIPGLKKFDEQTKAVEQGEKMKGEQGCLIY